MPGKLATWFALGCIAAAGALPDLRAATEYTLDPVPNLTVRSRSNATVNIARETSEGRFLMLGSFRYVDGMPVSGFERFQTNGQLDPSFVTPYDGVVSRFAVRPDGRIWLIRGSVDVNGAAITNLALATSDGVIDPTFPPVDIAATVVRDIIALPDNGCYLIQAPPGFTGVLRLNAFGQVVAEYPAVSLTGSFIGPVLAPDGALAFIRANSAGPAAVTVLGATGIVQPSLAAIPSNYRPFGAVYEPDGSLVLSGQTFSGTGPGLIRILPGGQRDLSFTGTSPFSNFAGSGIIRLTDGSFATILSSGTPNAPQILRFSSTGAYLPAASLFVSNAPDGAPGNLQLLPLADGDFLLTGRFLAVNNVTVPTIARIAQSGLVRDNFFVDLLAPGQITTLTSFGASSQLLGGVFTEIGANDAGHLAVLTPIDTVEATATYLPFGGPLRAFGTADGGAVVMGSFPSPTGASPSGLAKLTSAGQVDPSFLSGLTLSGFEAGVQLPDGNIVLAGRFGAQPVPTPPASFLTRVLPSGLIDPSFNNHSTIAGPSGSGLTAVGADQTGQLVVAGNFTSFQGAPRRGLARTSPAGIVDPTFVPAIGVAASPLPRNITMLPDGGFYILALRDDQPLSSSQSLLRFNPDGSIDPTFTPSLGGRSVAAYVVAADGSLFVSVGVLAQDEQSSPRILHLDHSGQVDPLFDCVLEDSVASALAMDGSGRLLIGGRFTLVNGQYREALARFTPVPFGIMIAGPNEVTVRLLSTITFEASVVSAPGAVAYQWFHDGEPIRFATDPTLTLSHIVPKFGGEYTVTATVGTEIVSSTPVRLVAKRGRPGN